jgi:hypothetical protein
MSDAVSIAVALGSALSTVWGYYITVVIGLAAAIGTLAATGKVINDQVKIVITIAVVLFTVVNVYSLYSTMSNLNFVIDYIANNNELRPIVQKLKFDFWMLGLPPVGTILLIIWLWRY